jgi:hypothetical protein
MAMEKRSCFILILALLIQMHGKAQQGWTLRKESDGIKVYSRNDPQSKFNELKAELTVQAKLSDLAALILDVPAYHEWSYNTKLSYILKKEGPAELFFYTEINSPWPASNRDLALHLRLTQDAVSRVMTIREESAPDLVPQKKGIVRIHLSKETWTVTPIDKAAIRIDYQIEVDPGTSAPAWLINAFATKGSLETFRSLREQIRQPKYREAILPFIKN